MIQVDGLGKRFLDYQRGWISAVTDVSFVCRPGAIFGLSRPQWRRQDDDAANSLHGAEADGGPGRSRRVRRRDESRKCAGQHRLHVSQHGDLRPDDRVGTGRVFRATAWHDRRGLCAVRMEEIFEWLKMNDFRDVLGSKMSTGMKQKASIRGRSFMTRRS